MSVRTRLAPAALRLPTRIWRWPGAPEPRVGYVLVKDGAIVGEGWYRKTGEPHAEILACARRVARRVGRAAM